MFKYTVAATVVALAGGTPVSPWDPATGQTMNGQYTMANPVKGVKVTHRGTNFFEVVTPSYFSTYAEVNWGAFTVPLDPDIVKELDGKLVNFVGYEFDLVRTLPNKTTVSVPAWELYNHHFGNTMMGKGVSMVKSKIPGDHEKVEYASEMERLFPGYRFVQHSEDNVRRPLAEYASGGMIVGNGAESRKTFHYYADGYGVLVESPNAVGIHPMIIDTMNREGGGTPQRPTGHGIVPPSASAGPEEMYSPIHECPCTDKWPKKISSFSTQSTGTCNPAITNGSQCFAAAAELGLHPVFANKSVDDATSPPGCSVTATQGGYDIVYNTNTKTTVTCGEPPSNTPSGPPLNYTCDLNGNWMQVDAGTNHPVFSFNSTGVNTYSIYQRGVQTASVVVSAPTVALPQGSLTAQWGKTPLFADLGTYAGEGSPTCSRISWNNTVIFAKLPFANNPVAPTVPPRVAGTAEDLTNITVDIDASKDLVTITLQGPSTTWFGAGFGYHHVSTGGADPSVGVSMVGTNWTLVVLGDGTVQERALGNHEPGVQLPNTINVTSNTVVGDTRTVVVTRTIKGEKSDDEVFDPTANQLTYINAVGDGPYLVRHKAKSSGVLYLIELDYPTCICNKAGDQGTIGGYSWGTNRCVGRPLGQMLDDPQWASNHGVNPSCDIKAYRGGLRCCKGGTIILDSDQNVTNNFIFEWQLKYRYYYEVVTDPTTVTNTFMTSWWTEHNNGEHDVPKCAPNSSECVYAISSNFTAGMLNGCANGCSFITMEGHCHIGCNGMELWIVDDETNPVLLCNATIAYGDGDGRMNEMGYIAGANNCVFGNNASGWASPTPLHPLTKLRSIKMSNNTSPYTGDMALWEINAAPLAADFVFEHETAPLPQV